MNRVSESGSTWWTLAAPLRPPASDAPPFDVADLREHRAQRAAFVRLQIERAESDCRATSLLAVLLLAVDAILLGASAVACGLQPGGWLAWPMLAVALVSGGLLFISAFLLALCLWRREPGAGAGAATSLANPHEMAAAFPDAPALQAQFHRSLLTDLERQSETEWLRAAKSARTQWRTLLWAVAFTVAALAAIAAGIVALAASGI